MSAVETYYEMYKRFSIDYLKGERADSEARLKSRDSWLTYEQKARIRCFIKAVDRILAERQ